MKIYLEMDGENVLSWGTAPISADCIEFEIDPSHPIFESVRGYKVRDGELFKDGEGLEQELLNEIRKIKETELNKACQDAILAGFSHEVEGIKYWFSYDIEAQMNFERLNKLFEQGVITERMWTAKDESGEYVRVSINKQSMRELTIIAVNHVDRKISKFRDYYLSLILDATSIEEVEAIQWETDEEVMTREELQDELDMFNSTPTVEQLREENEGLKSAMLELLDMLFEM